MAAAILQFKSNQHQQQEDQTDYTDFTMTKEYYHMLVEMLDKEHPFKAIRLASEFNEANGFNLIPVVEIEKWKRFLTNQK